VNPQSSHYSPAMRRGLLFALLLVTACKKQPPAGDLPPAGDPSAKPAVASPHGEMAAPSGNPHGAPAAPGMANPHGDAPADPHSQMPTANKVEPKTPDKLADGRLALGPFSVAPPPKWTVKPVTSSMRAADFVLPGNDAELIVYYFGPSGAGSIDENLDRWFNQFQQPDGKKSRDAAKIEKLKLGGQDATYVSVSGRFVASAMPGGSESVDKADQRMLAAIVASPSGPYYFKLVGAKATVDANSAAFLAMLSSLKLR
jgi:hypothetical protein